jgi:uncharacterized protein (DUF885 family)
MTDRRGFVQQGVTLIAGAAAVPLLGACKLESRRDLADDGFVQLRDRYFREQLVLNPVTATYLGADGYDAALRPLGGRLRDYSQDALDDEARDYRRLERALGALDPALLTPSRRIDHAVIGGQIAFLKYLLDRRHHERAVDTYVGEPFRGIDWQIQQMRQFEGGRRGDEAEWRLVVTRLSAIPPYLSVARANLEAGRRSGNMPDRRMVQRDGIAGSRANATYFRETLPTRRASSWAIDASRRRCSPGSPAPGTTRRRRSRTSPPGSSARFRSTKRSIATRSDRKHTTGG